MNGTPRPFAVSVEHLDRGPVVRVTGEVDLSTAPHLESELVALADSEARGEGGRVITVDLAETDFLDSTGLHALVVAVRCARKHGSDLIVRNPSRPVARVLELSGLATVVRVVQESPAADG